MKHMKNNRIILLLVFILSLTFALQSCGLIFTFSIVDSAITKSYYADKTNYIEAEGCIESYHYDQERNTYYLTLQPDWLPQKESGSSNFQIMGNAALILKENNVEEKLASGSFIRFSYAPRYFGDGYIRPMASLTVDGETLLTFDEGYQGLLEAL